MRVRFGRPIDAILAVVLAPRCLICQVPIDTPLDGPICPACWHSMRPLTPPLCARCGDALPGWRTADEAARLCARCRRQLVPIALGRAAGAYDGALRLAIHALKYERRRTLAARLGGLMRTRCRDVLVGADLVVPVPLHWRRRSLRGFNQADDLAKHLGLPICRALCRIRATQPQFGLPAARRRRNLRGAFALRGTPVVPWWRPSAPIVGACVVLVDDVWTTGATLAACAAVLRSGGAREVRAITAARALSEPRSPRPRPHPR